ncbi:MAG: class II aldolase/adducin family protein [Pseudomonadota bacterium]
MSAQLKLQPTPKIECSPEEWEARVDLACCYRIVSHLGWHHSLIYNHISMRVPGPEVHFLLNPLGLMYHEITASNLLKIDLDGKKVVPSPYPVHTAGFVVHSSVHRVREDVKCVIHTHSKAGVAVACQEQGLLPINLGAMGLYDKIAYYDVEGVTNDTDECKRIAQALGNKNVMILRNHGLLTCGATAGHAFNLMRRLELACETQIMAQSGGAKLIYPSMDVVRKTSGQTTMTVDQGVDVDGPGMMWAAVRRLMDQLDPSYAT